MKLDITVCHSILKYCFQADEGFISADTNAMTVWHEINKNRIVLNDDLIVHYECEFETEFFFDNYQQWFSKLTTETPDDTLILGNDLSIISIDSLFTSDEYLQILNNLAYSTQDKIIFSNLLHTFKNPLELLKILPMNINRILDRNERNYYNDYWLPYNREIQTGERNTDLSKWFERIFKDENNITIIDPYLFQNKSKLKDYILPSIKHGANLTFYTEFTKDYSLSRSNKCLRKSDFETEFSSDDYSNWNIINIYSVQHIEIHDRSIRTDKYFIGIGNGLAVFGNNGLTKRITIHLLNFSNWNGTLPTIDTTIM